jgi:hypothetical protein
MGGLFFLVKCGARARLITGRLLTKSYEDEQLTGGGLKTPKKMSVSLPFGVWWEKKKKQVAMPITSTKCSVLVCVCGGVRPFLALGYYRDTTDPVCLSGRQGSTLFVLFEEEKRRRWNV